MSRNRSIFSQFLASTISKIGFQGGNLLYFLVVAVLVSKDDLGIYSFCISSATVLVSLLTLGNSPTVVRRIAGKAAPLPAVAGTVLFQRALFPIVLFVCLAPVIVLLQDRIPHLGFLMIAFAICSLGAYVEAIRQLFYARQMYWWATGGQQVQVVSKLVFGLVLVSLGAGVNGLLLGLLAGIVFDAVFSGWGVRREMQIWSVPKPHWQELGRLIKEGLPLMGAMLFNQALARADWILMGALRSSSETGEYSFAYRVFEISWMPHAILGTLLLPKLSSAIRGGDMSDSMRNRVGSLLQFTIAVSAILPLVMVVCWTPVIDFLTQGKYGSVNSEVIKTLAVSVPFAAGTGVMWNVAMARLKNWGIMLIICVSSVLNILLNSVLIPMYGGQGAAFATSIPMVFQFFAYAWILRSDIAVGHVIRCLVLVQFFAIGSVVVSVFLSVPWVVAAAIGTLLFVMSQFCLGTFSKKKVLEIIGTAPNSESKDGAS